MSDQKNLMFCEVFEKFYSILRQRISIHADLHDQ